MSTNHYQTETALYNAAAMHIAIRCATKQYNQPDAERRHADCNQPHQCYSSPLHARSFDVLRHLKVKIISKSRWSTMLSADAHYIGNLPRTMTKPCTERKLLLPVACRCSLLVDLFFSSERTLRKNLLPAHLCRTGCAFCIGNEIMHERGSLRTKKAENKTSTQ